MAIAGGTIPCMYFKLNGDKLSQHNGRALREIVYSDLGAALRVLLDGSPVYIELYGDNLSRFQDMIAARRGELRFK